MDHCLDMVEPFAPTGSNFWIIFSLKSISCSLLSVIRWEKTSGVKMVIYNNIVILPEERLLRSTKQNSQKSCWLCNSQLGFAYVLLSGAKWTTTQVHFTDITSNRSDLFLFAVCINVNLNFLNLFNRFKAFLQVSIPRRNCVISWAGSSHI